ncbi:MAG: methyltransferase [Kofleriaceae bacterium]
MITARGLAAWAGTDRLAGLRLPEARALTIAAAPYALFVAGDEVPIDRLRGLPIEMLLERALIERIGDRARARVAILPHRQALLVCDRRDAEDHEDLVAWPDDSSYHLAATIPASRRPRWLDLGCGSAFAQLARPELATRMVGVDLNPRAVAYAKLGAELSGIAHLEVRAQGVGEPAEPAELVTCNAPMPGVWNLAIWQRAGEGFFAELWPAIRTALAPGGLAVVHAARRAIPADLPGDRTIVAYAPDFAVLWWHPDAPDRVVQRERILTAERPHLDARDREIV